MVHETLEGLSSTFNPKPKGEPSLTGTGMVKGQGQIFGAVKGQVRKFDGSKILIVVTGGIIGEYVVTNAPPPPHQAQPNLCEPCERQSHLHVHVH